MASSMWAKLQIVLSTVVTSYALLFILLISFGINFPTWLNTVLWYNISQLALLTGLVGIVSGWTTDRIWITTFLVLLLIVEALSLWGLRDVAFRMMTGYTNTPGDVVVEHRLMVATATTGNGHEMLMVSDQTEAYIDSSGERACVERIKHALLMACIGIGAVCVLLAWCTGQLMESTNREMKRLSASKEHFSDPEKGEQGLWVIPPDDEGEGNNSSNERETETALLLVRCER